MAVKYSPHALDLIRDATLKSFWRRRSLYTFLRRCRVSERYLSAWREDESKRDLLDRLIPDLERAKFGQEILRQMAEALVEQTRFPDLQNWEDSERKIREAHVAVQALRRLLDTERAAKEEDREAAQSRQRVRALREAQERRRVSLASLETRLAELSTQIGTQEAGYAFQAWLSDLLDQQELVNRRPYVTPSGRQVDGSVTIEGTTYLLELTFTKGPTGSADVDTALKKVSDKADNTMGIMISMAGFTSTAISEASTPRTPLLLLDAQHLYLVLRETLTFSELVSRVRRHASQTGQAYLAARDFGGS